MPPDFITSTSLRLLAHNIDKASNRDRDKSLMEAMIEVTEASKMELEFLLTEYQDKIK